MLSDARNALPWEPLAEAGRIPMLIVRHGQTPWNREGRFLGRSDVALDETGQSQAGALSAFLANTPLSSAWSSPLLRATATADAVLSGRALPLHQDPRLAELDQGHLEGKKVSALLTEYADFFAAWQRDPASCRVPGGESFPDCQRRGMDALAEIASASRPGPPILVVTHNMLIRAVVCAIRDLPLKRFRSIDQKNTAVNLLSYGDGGFAVHQLNVCAHLKDR